MVIRNIEVTQDAASLAVTPYLEQFNEAAGSLTTVPKVNAAKQFIEQYIRGPEALIILARLLFAESNKDNTNDNQKRKLMELHAFLLDRATAPAPARAGAGAIADGNDVVLGTGEVMLNKRNVKVATFVLKHVGEFHLPVQSSEFEHHENTMLPQGARDQLAVFFANNFYANPVQAVINDGDEPEDGDDEEEDDDPDRVQLELEMEGAHLHHELMRRVMVRFRAKRYLATLVGMIRQIQEFQGTKVVDLVKVVFTVLTSMLPKDQIIKNIAAMIFPPSPPDWAAAEWNHTLTLFGQAPKSADSNTTTAEPNMEKQIKAGKAEVARLQKIIDRQENTSKRGGYRGGGGSGGGGGYNRNHFGYDYNSGRGRGRGDDGGGGRGNRGGGRGGRGGRGGPAPKQERDDDEYRNVRVKKEPHNYAAYDE